MQVREPSQLPPPRIIRAGEAALLVRFGERIDPAINDRVLALMAALDADPIPGLIDLVPSYAALLARFSPLHCSAARLVAHLRTLITALAGTPPPVPTRHVTIPVTYGGASGPDLADVARITGLSPEEIIRLHTAAVYRVYFLGFLAGFPYLGGLPDALRVPRLPTPRALVPAGSVGLAEAQTGIYPVASPGGWRIIGHTPLTLFDPAADPPTLLHAGDEVRFVPIDGAHAPAHPSIGARFSAVTLPHSAANDDALTHRWLRVIDAGPATTVQDQGRPGYARYGISPSGAADALALALGNALLGNPPDAAALECTLAGGTYEILTPCVVALAGAPCTAWANGAPVRWGLVTALPAGVTLTIGAITGGARAYLCVAGGVAVAPVLGSRATDVRAGLGGVDGRPLQSGDILMRGHAPRAFARAGWQLPRDWQPRAPADRAWTVRVLPGPHGPLHLDALSRCRFIVDPHSDRMGVRLRHCDNNSGMVLSGGQVLSEGVPRGAIQIPPDGQPIILLADHQTTGGYRVPAVVAGADLWQVAQMRPGDRVRFQPITRRAALAALREQAVRIALAQQGNIDTTPDINTLMPGFTEWYDEENEER